MNHLLDKGSWQDYLVFEQTYQNLSDYKFASNNLKLDQIQEEIIRTNNTAHAYFFAFETNYKIHKMQAVVLKNADPKYLYKFARFIPQADIKKIAKILAEQVTNEKKFVRYAHSFLKHVKGANVLQFKDTIMASGKPRYLYWMAKHLKSRKEIAQIENQIINAKSFTYARLMAQYIPGADLSKLEQFILDSGNVKQIKKFAKAVKNSKSRHLAILF